MRYKRSVYFFVLSILFLVRGLSGEESLQPLVDALVEMAREHRQHPSKAAALVAIGGCPAVGKTYLTKTLLNLLEEKGIHATTLPSDHFNLSPQERKQIGTEWDIRHFKVGKLHDCLFSIASGKKRVEKPTCNQLTGEIGEEVLELDDIDLILFDSLYALCSIPPLNFFDYCSMGVFLEAEESDIYHWKWEREQKKTVKRTPEQFSKHMEALLLEYHQNIEYSKKNAAFILKKDSNHYYKLEKSLANNEISCEDWSIPSNSLGVDSDKVENPVFVRFLAILLNKSYSVSI